VNHAPRGMPTRARDLVQGRTDAVSDSRPAAERRGLPACRVDGQGRRHVDLRLVVSLAVPFVANSAMQTVLNLTDTWFIGRISTRALAAMAGVYWLVLVVILLLGGIGLAVQTVAAQAFGGGRRIRAAQAAWLAIWGSLAAAPLFAVSALGGAFLLDPFQLEAGIESLALDYWTPRVGFAWVGVATWALLGFFNGIGRPRITLLVTTGIAIANAILNEVLIFRLGLGIAGAAWATNAAMLLGLGFAMSLFLGGWIHSSFRSRLVWRPDWSRMAAQIKLGFPMGLLYAADLLGFALFQLMQVRLSSIDGAATQIAMMLTTVAYLPGVGIALTGTTLVGQSIGAGDRAWARQLGNTVIAMSTAYMGIVGVLLAAAGPWLVPAFIADGDPLAADVVRVGALILWIAAAYQLFDGLNLGSGFSLRGAGDATVPAAMVIVLSWFVFVPLAHALTFAEGAGWVDFLPQFGLGAVGGWWAAVAYIAALGIILHLRWRSRAWERIKLR